MIKDSILRAWIKEAIFSPMSYSFLSLRRFSRFRNKLQVNRQSVCLKKGVNESKTCSNEAWLHKTGCTLSCDKFFKQIETALRLCSGAGETDSWKQPEVKNLVALSLEQQLATQMVIMSMSKSLYFYYSPLSKLK